MNGVKTGLDQLLEKRSRLQRLRESSVGLLANPASITSDSLEHSIDALTQRGIELDRLFGPEHGIRAQAQDMEAVDSNKDPISGIPTVSLYGDTIDSLAPDPDTTRDLDIVLADLQDIGARYYTYAYTVGLTMRTCGTTDTDVWVLDRPNPIRGDKIEGNILKEEFKSFVGMQPLATRHGMTLGELAVFFKNYGGWDCNLDVVECSGWKRHMWYDETDLPWTAPSPNMPTLTTAAIYPGLCLLEGTNCSEGRGTTKPFELFGAPYVDPYSLRNRLRSYELPGLDFRVTSFRPEFQKHAGQTCHGLQIHLQDRNRVRSVATGYAIISALHELHDQFAWRNETYEFVDDIPAIDLLIGDRKVRRRLESGADPIALADETSERFEEYLNRRRTSLLYS